VSGAMPDDEDILSIEIGGKTVGANLIPFRSFL
jgi:hypothetical protein